ncbi:MULTISPECIES: alkaline phosphatase D family protein [unclassified Pseudomonas]|uniref:alkaline phosphatase D family protein n=1 Tax=unclassified Pseudomonas TaxID=196821 RepID=UPI000A1EB8AB|nr:MULTISPECIES: alkaline phosphatase D family protein [unclassified Pseudomonas]
MAYLIARPLLGAPDEIKLWVGAFDVPKPPTVSFTVGSQPFVPVAAGVFAPIRDRKPGNPYSNFQAVFTFKALGAGVEHPVRVDAGAGFTPYFLRVTSLPASVPAKLQGSFKILLASCYCCETDAVDVGRFIQRLPVKPDMALFAGDQVYLDAPALESMPQTEDALRQAISRKYRHNWLSEMTGGIGLQQGLSKAPAFCLPDDHEFWNNYPWSQFWKNGTQTAPTPAGGVNLWADAAREMYADYQQGGTVAQTSLRLDIEPLSMLFLDTRSQRMADFNHPQGLMPIDAENAFKLWANDLIASQGKGQPRIGVLATGQTLSAQPAFMDKLGDAELANYGVQYKMMIDTLDRLGQHGIQVVFLTGDVHWSRVMQASNMKTSRTCLTEVVCSPTSLVPTPVVDQLAKAGDFLHGIFGDRQQWPLHSDPEKAPASFGNKAFRPDEPTRPQGWRGNHVALVEFSRSGFGVELKVTYYPITAPPTPASSAGPFTLLNA